MRKFLKGRRGAVQIGGIILMGISMVFLAVGFIVYPIATDGTDDLLDYEYSEYTTITDDSFTGFTEIVGITPLLLLVGYLSAAVFTMFLGVKVMRGAGSAKLDLGGMILLALSIIFVAIGLIIMPVTLDGVASVMAHRETQTDEDTTVTTGVGVTTGNMTLTQVLFDDDVTYVTSVSSNITETPVADNFSEPLLYLTALSANETRTLTCVYDYHDELAEYTGLYAVLEVTPLMILISFIGGAIVSGFFGIKRIGSSI